MQTGINALRQNPYTPQAQDSKDALNSDKKKDTGSLRKYRRKAANK